MLAQHVTLLSSSHSDWECLGIHKEFDWEAWWGFLKYHLEMELFLYPASEV